MTESNSSTPNYLRHLPAVDALLREPQVREFESLIGSVKLAALARAVLDELRAELTKMGGSELSRAALKGEATHRLNRAARAERTNAISRVINATGVILHTNLGRAPLAESVRQAMVERAAGYCTVEYDLETGSRGRRGRKAEELLAELTGAEAGVVVNNGAAAALLVLTALTSGGEVVLSRGELVEIGGDFRIPDVMLASGAELSEVGTTNRTKLADYERAITEKTVMLMRVHPSNYRLVGFTATPELNELAELAHARGLWLYEDAGSGALIDLAEHGLTGEPIIRDSIAAGADIVSFSGDKLMGGVQAGLIVGRAELLDRIRRHPLYRALRPDKTTLAAVEATLSIYRRGAELAEIPTLAMLAVDADTIKARAEKFIASMTSAATANFTIELVPGESAIGGGSAPTTHPPTVLIALTHPTLSADQLAAALRRHDPPVIARIVDDRVMLDLRTVSEEEESELLAGVLALSQ
jgi:L-seryl-tRNA(Ser) seleniumtransferase